MQQVNNNVSMSSSSSSSSSSGSTQSNNSAAMLAREMFTTGVMTERCNQVTVRFNEQNDLNNAKRVYETMMMMQHH
jgi:hypothetical protein